MFFSFFEREDMSKFQAIFLIQSRAGHVAHINYETLKSLCDLDIVLVGSEAVIEDVEEQGYIQCLADAIVVDGAYEFEEIAASIDSYIKKTGYVDFIVSTINESKNLLVDRLNAYFGQSEDREIEKFVCKDRMKDFLISKGVIEGPYTLVDKAAFKTQGRTYLRSVADRYGYPMFIKPVDMYASKHCSKLVDEDAFHAFMEDTVSTEPSQFHVEPFMDGTLYGCDSIMVDGQLAFSQVIEFSHPNVHVYTRPCLGWVTVPESDEIAQTVSAFSKTVNEKMLPDRNGVTHLETFNHEGENTFLEISFRPIGGEPTPFYQRRANIPLREVHLALQATSDLRIPKKTKNHVAYFHINFAESPGTVASRNLPIILSNYEIEWFCKPGDTVPKNSAFDAFAGSLILWNADYDRLRDDFQRISEFPDFITLECLE